MPGGIPYAVNQQATALAYGSITATSASSANAFMTMTAQRGLMTLVSTINQPIIVLRNGVYWHYIAAYSSAPPSAVFDLGSDNGYLDVGVTFTVYAVSATPTSGTLYGMAA